MASSSSRDGGSPWKKHSCRSSGEPPEEKQLRNWEDLPWEVTASIFSRLMATEILMRVQFVCKPWFDICKDPLLWRRINVVNDREAAVGRLCRHAVDRSCGGLLDINIDYFGTDDLLEYITDRCVQIKRLRLARCYHVSDAGLNNAITKLPLLEELDLSLCTFSKEPLKAAGRCCPRLQSLKLNRQGRIPCFVDPNEGLEVNENAFAIANHMPELRHLQLLGDRMNETGLQAILDGCSHLESLDLRHCHGIELKGKLKKRCIEQIKSLQLSH
ncbi:hypothetical protein TIFTF001_007669 [Ficus carica]|uniref:F-box domain-containing protein n=1 Tax=Ficus carica TaxID=3494 RepID=A0AA88A3E2_FICCA|nr:hypothetical protein TIFTF001_007669 [Ficus carica]